MGADCTVRIPTASCICRSIRAASSTAPSRAIRRSRPPPGNALLRGARCRPWLGPGGEPPRHRHGDQIAKKHGLGAVAVRNSSHFGAAGYYADHAAEQGLIGLAFSNAQPGDCADRRPSKVCSAPIRSAPHFPVPDADPIVADMATAMVARSRIRHALAAGQTTIPEGWALDPSGRPTTDPARGGERARSCRSAARRGMHWR